MGERRGGKRRPANATGFDTLGVAKRYGKEREFWGSQPDYTGGYEYTRLQRSRNGVATARGATSPPRSRKEKRIPLPILPYPLGIIPRRVELLPRAGGEDVLVPLVPPAIDDLGQTGIVGVTLELGVRDLLGLFLRAGGEGGEGLLGGLLGCRRGVARGRREEVSRSGGGRARGVGEERLLVVADGAVEGEVVEIVVLSINQNVSSESSQKQHK